MLMGGGDFFSNLHHFSTGENGKKSRFSKLKNFKLSLVLLCRMLHHIIYICVVFHHGYQGRLKFFFRELYLGSFF